MNEEEFYDVMFGVSKSDVDNISCYESLESEVIKLYCIILNGEGPFSRDYMLEKIDRIIEGVPLTMHPLLYKTYLEILNEIKEKKSSVSANKPGERK
jgi:hypothetical protein